jgi:hypothetical protein
MTKQLGVSARINFDNVFGAQCSYKASHQTRGIAGSVFRFVVFDGHRMRLTRNQLSQVRRYKRMRYLRIASSFVDLVFEFLPLILCPLMSDVGI